MSGARQCPPKIGRYRSGTKPAQPLVFAWLPGLEVSVERYNRLHL